mgnify:CR=1 FL=1
MEAIALFNLIYADPPWEYKDKCKDGNRGAGFKYPTMKAEDIARIPVWQLANLNRVCWPCGGFRLSQKKRCWW